MKRMLIIIEYTHKGEREVSKRKEKRRDKICQLRKEKTDLKEKIKMKRQIWKRKWVHFEKEKENKRLN